MNLAAEIHEDEQDACGYVNGSMCHCVIPAKIIHVVNKAMSSFCSSSGSVHVLYFE